MKVEYFKMYSEHLGQDMELKVYGDKGIPIIVFPAMGGRFTEFEDFGMTIACSDFIEQGKFQFFTVDSVDNQSWLNLDKFPSERALRHEQYDRSHLKSSSPPGPRNERCVPALRVRMPRSFTGCRKDVPKAGRRPRAWSWASR